MIFGEFGYCVKNFVTGNKHPFVARLTSSFIVEFLRDYSQWVEGNPEVSTNLYFRKSDGLCYNFYRWLDKKFPKYGYFNELNIDSRERIISNAWDTFLQISAGSSGSPFSVHNRLKELIGQNAHMEMDKQGFEVPEKYTSYGGYYCYRNLIRQKFVEIAIANIDNDGSIDTGNIRRTFDEYFNAVCEELIEAHKASLPVVIDQPSTEVMIETVSEVWMMKNGKIAQVFKDREGNALCYRVAGADVIYEFDGAHMEYQLSQ